MEVGMMKQKKLIFFMLVVIFFGLPTMLSAVTAAQNPEISIKSFNSTLVNKKTIGTREFRYFDLFVVIQNTGSGPSDELFVELADPELNTTIKFSTTPAGGTSNFTLQPAEMKTLYIDNWPTSMQGDLSMNISYQPNDPQQTHYSYNSGYTVYTIPGEAKKKSSTPGFELIIGVVAIGLLLVIQRNRKK
jgi:hypothetical protein